MEDKLKEIVKYSNPLKVIKNMKKYFGHSKELYLSTKKNKKYMIKNDDNKFVHFGEYGMEDYTKHNDNERRYNYIRRASNIKGNWKNNKYSPNNLSINLLWS